MHNPMSLRLNQMAYCGKALWSTGSEKGEISQLENKEFIGVIFSEIFSFNMNEIKYKSM